MKVSTGIITNLPGGYPATYLSQDLVNKNQVLANVFNGKTPTGTEWSQGYNQGYLFFSGVIYTYGNWDKFWMGWTNAPYVNIGSQTSLRVGGSNHHTGEFIHSSCNGYKDIDHSITSRWDWKNKRVFWVRL